jgi:hypothetical protein
MALASAQDSCDQFLQANSSGMVAQTPLWQHHTQTPLPREFTAQPSFVLADVAFVCCCCLQVMAAATAPEAVDACMTALATAVT